LLKVLDAWTEAIEEGYYVDCVYMDLMKAFDKVPHKRLMTKLKHYGIVGRTFEWICDFISNHEQYVELNGKCSKWYDVISGIPQGTVLGPILFVIFTNDLPSNISSEAYMFTDDTKVFQVIRDQNDIDILQRDMDRLSEWLSKWLLTYSTPTNVLLHV